MCVSVVMKLASACASAVCSVADCCLSQVCSHVTRCYAVASQFEGCREKIQENSSIVRDVCRILYYKVGYRKGCGDLIAAVPAF